MLNDHEFMRYSRQLLLEDIGPEGQGKLKTSKVLIVGLGGLGAPASLYLAAAGVGELWLADHDELHLSNLQRQVLYGTEDIPQSKAKLAAKRLQDLNPLIHTHVLQQKLDIHTLLPLVEQVDLVLDCCDNMATRHAVMRPVSWQIKRWLVAVPWGLVGSLWCLSHPLITAVTHVYTLTRRSLSVTVVPQVCLALSWGS